EPDTDFSLPHHAEWAKQIVAKWKPKCGQNATDIPLVVAGEEVGEGFAARTSQPQGSLSPGEVGSGRRGNRNRPPAQSTKRTVRECLDPSRPGVIVGRCLQASAEDVERAVACAVADEDGWRALSAAQRYDKLGEVARELRRARADLIGAALANAGKTIAESDPEVSEAVDFVEFYSASARYFQELPTLHTRGKGVVVVVSPWNFPLAIPCGGMAAALAAGNTVILKPASDATLVAYELCQCFWRAGVSRKALQFLPCSGSREGAQLVSHPRVNAVILTGGTETAFTMLRQRPDIHLLAETGGKNATIVTALADRDQAIQHVLHSAFSHSGQKCSATSLLLLEAEVYDDPEFQRVFCDAVESIPVGSAWELKKPSGDLENALKVLEPGEAWAVMPRRLEDNPNLWSPGVKWGVQPGSYTHTTEFFGPVLGVMRLEKLGEAIALVNQTGYGLTSGLESLDDREQQIWQAGIRAGNLYLNRSTTGAVVLRQPFGGMGKSAFGPNIKAGGPNYVAQFMECADADSARSRVIALEGQLSDQQLEGLRRQLAEWARDAAAGERQEMDRLIRACESYDRAMKEEFGREHDPYWLIGQDNIRRYLPVRWLRLRVHPADTFFDLVARVGAAKAAGCRITVSIPEGLVPPAVRVLEEQLTASWAAAIEFVWESDEELAIVIREHQADRIRYAAPDRVAAVVRQAAAETGLCIVSAPVLMEGRIELLWYLQEQSICYDYHRYGNLGVRAGEPRAEIC
ncbi:MAG: proline dehydrogenase, partial [Verrucomicrobia bacterium]